MRKSTVLALVLLQCTLPSSAAPWSFLRGASKNEQTLPEENPRGLRVRVFHDLKNVMWEKNQGNNDLTPTVLNNWIVSVDGVDIGRTEDGTGLVYEASGDIKLEGGVDICVRPPSRFKASEDSCRSVGIQCVQTKWSVNGDKFPHRSEIVDNPNFSGVMWEDGPDSEQGTASTWWKVYVKDFCYTLRESDFVERDMLDEAWVRFSLIEATDFPTGAPSPAPTSSPSSVPSASPSASPSDAPSDAPSSAPTASVAPSAMPSASPSDAPSSTPTASVAPSDMPSSAPSVSVEPSSAPSDAPSLTPSDAPSMVPSSTPSVMPSDAPSMVPSSTPSDAPSTSPSGEPSFTPSAAPSRAPSM